MERLKYQRQTDITHVGLNQKDMDDRSVVAVGYAFEELLPPYDNIDHEKRAASILAYTQQFTRVARCTSPLSISEMLWEAAFPNQKIVEVVGGYADFCVPFAVEALTRTGLYALVESQFTFATNSSYADFTLGKMIMRGVLRDKNQECMIIGREKYLFYRADKSPSTVKP